MKLSTLALTGYPFHPARRRYGSPTMHRLRVAARREQYKRHRLWKRVGAQAVGTLLWPIGAAIFAIHHGIEHGAKPSKILDAWWLALSRNVPPLEYFSYRLWETERRKKLDNYLYWTEDSLALAALNRAAGVLPENSPVDDKVMFQQYCMELQIPTPSIFGVWELGSQISGNALPKQDLWVKPVKSSGGVGAERWYWRGKEYQRNHQVLRPDQMAAHIARHSNTHKKTLVQQVIHASPDHASLIGEAPLCIRIVTGHRRSGKVEVIDAMAIWPRAGSEISQGGHIAMIDIANGRLGKAFEPIVDEPTRELDGKLLPDWSSILDYVQRGHAKLDKFVFLGWDVAIGREGPIFLETNSGWGSFHFQVIPDRPLGDTAFASIAAEYI